MSYEKNTWQKGDVITATKLNHMEDGIAGGGSLLITAVIDGDAGTMTLNKTWNEINTAISGGIIPVITTDFEGSLEIDIMSAVTNDYGVMYYWQGEPQYLQATSADGYPSTTLG